MKKILFCLLVCIVVTSCKQKRTNTKLKGTVFGTTYAITYDSEINYQKAFDSLFVVLNQSLSTYQNDSDISKLNRNEPVKIDEHFIKVYEASRVIYNQTKGVFDPTIGAVVNAWDFGPKGRIVNLDSLKIDSLMLSVGLNKVIRQDKNIIKPIGAFIDFNAIAKGYAVDVLGEFLESQGVYNYLVEIGGEIRVKGENVEKESPWKVGVENPNFDGTQSILKAITLKNRAMATSGTYRKFKIDEAGNRYAHIINTKTGYPSKTNILSVSVLAETCMEADAYATAFKAMGIEAVKLFLEEHPQLQVLLIVDNENKDIETLSINSFPEK